MRNKIIEIHTDSDIFMSKIDMECCNIFLCCMFGLVTSLTVSLHAHYMT